MIKKLYLDTETTGTNPKEHGIFQISGIIEIDGEVKKEFDIHMQPRSNCKIEKAALDVTGKTVEEIMSYQPMKSGYNEFISILSQFINQFDKRDKFIIVGYFVTFDTDMMRQWFLDNGNKYYGSFFWSNTIGVDSFASLFLQEMRPQMENFKLMTVAKYLGIEIDKTKLHDSLYDIQITRECMKKMFG